MNNKLVKVIINVLLNKYNLKDKQLNLNNIFVDLFNILLNSFKLKVLL